MTAADPGTLLVVVSDWDQSGWVERFASLDPARTLRAWPDIGDAADIRYVAAWKPPPGALQGLANLDAIFSLGAGVDRLVRDADLPNVPIVRVVDDSLTLPMTEYVVAEVLRHHRQHGAYLAAQRARIWKPLRQPGAAEVAVGLFGFGTLAQHAAKALLALGFQVNGWSRTPKSATGVTSFAGDAALDDFLGATDILVSLLPATRETHHLVDRALLGKLRRDGAFGTPAYINAGRGATQIEADIIASLDAGELCGASLDVFETEPLAATSPLWDHPNVIITPHVAAASDPEAICRYVIDQIRVFESGGSLENIVDRQRGY